MADKKDKKKNKARDSHNEGDQTELKDKSKKSAMGGKSYLSTTANLLIIIGTVLTAYIFIDFRFSTKSDQSRVVNDLKLKIEKVRCKCELNRIKREITDIKKEINNKEGENSEDLDTELTVLTKELSEETEGCIRLNRVYQVDSK